MSRFFTGGSSDESDDEVRKEESEDEEEKPVASTKGKFFKAKEEAEEDSSDQKRVVKPLRTRRLEELQQIADEIKKYMKANNFVELDPCFDKLVKFVEKNLTILADKGTSQPRPYLKILVELEDHLKKVKDTDVKDKVQAKKLKAFSEKLKKNNKALEKDISTFRTSGSTTNNNNAKDDDEDEDEDEEEESPKPTTKAPAKPAAAPAKSTKSIMAVQSDDEEDDDDDKWEDDDDNDDDDTERRAAEALQKPSGAAKWMLKELPKEEKKETKEEKKERREKEKKEKDKDKEETEKAKADAKKEKEKDKKEKEKKELKPSEVRAKIAEIASKRGARVEPQKQIDRLRDLDQWATTPDLKAAILVNVLMWSFDMSRSIKLHMPVGLWNQCHKNLVDVLNIIEKHPTLHLEESEESAANSLPAAISLGVSQDDAANTQTEEEKDTPLPVTLNLMAFIERLDDEWMKSLQSTEISNSYIERLGDESKILSVAARAQKYYEKENKMKHVARLAMRRVEHIYYKLDQHSKESATDTQNLMTTLSSIIYEHGDERLRTRMILCQIYYEALHDKFFDARDKLLMSHLQDSVSHMEIQTQVLFNRAMAQLGLCAFRAGFIRQAYSCLLELYGTQRIKELLAQGVTGNRYDRPDEKQDRRRDLPYHMHINLELLEGVHLICALLLEVPNMAAKPYDLRSKNASRFKKLVDAYDRNIFTGPPESTRDIIAVAAKALAVGDWKRSEELILGLSVWKFITNSDQVKAMVRKKIQEEGLVTYIFTYSQYYDSLSQQQLGEMFDLPASSVQSIISRMMINDDLHASWTQPAGLITLHKSDLSKSQYLATQFAEKITQFVDKKTPGFAGKYDPKSGNKGGQARRGGRNQQQGGNYNNRPQGQNNDQRRTQGGFNRSNNRGGMSNRGGRQDSNQ